MFWKDVDVESVSIPVRFQIPRGFCEYGVGSFGSVTIQLNSEENNKFFDWFKRLEDHLVKDQSIFESNVNRENGTIRLKYVDGFTQVFDSDSVYVMDGQNTLANCNVDALVEVSSFYENFKGRSGLVCKLFQAKVFPIGCMFSTTC